jgi:hypothetical protein
MTEEIWRPVLNFEGLYEVSNYGNVKSLLNRYKNVSILKPGNINGYFYVVLYKNKKPYTNGIHRLVLESFVNPAPTNKHHAAHNDGVRNNNYVYNLRWATAKENSADRVIHGTLPEGETHGKSKLTNEQVKYILNNYEYDGHKKSSIYQLCKKFSVSKDTILKIIRGQIWKSVDRSTVKSHRLFKPLLPYRGVELRKCGNYLVRIVKNNKKINLGMFQSAVYAALIYDKAAREFQGKRAKQNFPLTRL